MLTPYSSRQNPSLKLHKKHLLLRHQRTNQLQATLNLLAQHLDHLHLTQYTLPTTLLHPLPTSLQSPKTRSRKGRKQRRRRLKGLQRRKHLKLRSRPRPRNLQSQKRLLKRRNTNLRSPRRVKSHPKIARRIRRKIRARARTRTKVVGNKGPLPLLQNLQMLELPPMLHHRHHQLPASQHHRHQILSANLLNLHHQASLKMWTHQLRVRFPPTPLHQVRFI